LPGEFDRNFQVVTDRGGFILKMTHICHTESWVDLQCRALETIAEKCSQISLPRVRKTFNGELYTSFRDENGVQRLVWVLSWIPGKPMAGYRPLTGDLYIRLGRLLGRMDWALEGFQHEAARRKPFRWNPEEALWIVDALKGVPSKDRVLIEGFIRLFEETLPGRWHLLRRGVIYGDANDHNVLVGPADETGNHEISVIDFGDMMETVLAAEPAIASAYAGLYENDPLDAAEQVVSGYHREYPLSEEELAVLFPLMAMRLCVSVVNAYARKESEPGDPYITVSLAPALKCLRRMQKIHPRLAHYRFRLACGFDPVPGSKKILTWLERKIGRIPDVMENVRGESVTVFDLSVSSPMLGADPAAAGTSRLTRTLRDRMESENAKVGIGRYNEARLVYTSPLFTGENPLDASRTIHLGMDVFADPGTDIYCPLDGKIKIAVNNAAQLDYGPVIILEHSTDSGAVFYTLYGHLSEDSLRGKKPGMKMKAGDGLARVGASPVNGGWPPHLHFQIILDLLDRGRDFPGVVLPDQRELWCALSPDPNIILGVSRKHFPDPVPGVEETLERRKKMIGPSLSLSYQRSLKFVRGWMQYLYDQEGRAYLDAYNNVPHVGHSHPRVVNAAAAQAAMLNTNTRYLHDVRVEYAERLIQRLPKPLEVCFFVNSGSEANELALRLARTCTGRRDVMVLEGAYHGHTSALTEISPYKFRGPGGFPQASWVHTAPLPDDYRGPFRRNDSNAGTRYAALAEDVLGNVPEPGLAAFICESAPSVAGQFLLPDGYLKAVYSAVRERGGLCVADEVQTGFGRLGTHFWAFEAQGVIPDILVLGKPIGNGFPLAAVITTREIAAGFDNGMEFFSTFGGNPVSCAAGLAVLDVMEDEDLQSHALRVGRHLLKGLRAIQKGFSLIGDVRGSGLFIGLELVRDQESLEPAAEEAALLVNRLKDLYILTGTDGLYHNVVKIRPPMPFTLQDADCLLERLDSVLQEDALLA